MEDSDDNCDESASKEDESMYAELGLISEEDDEDEAKDASFDFEENCENESMDVSSVSRATSKKRNYASLRSLKLSPDNHKVRQPHIMFIEFKNGNRELNNAPKASIAEVLNALDMSGAVKDIKRFNYVCRVGSRFFCFMLSLKF